MADVGQRPAAPAATPAPRGQAQKRGKQTMRRQDYPPDFNKQCKRCHRVLTGIAADENPGVEVHHISRADDGSLVLLPEGDAEHPSNVSHGYCDDCAPYYAEEQRAMIEARRQRRLAEEAAQREQEGEA